MRGSYYLNAEDAADAVMHGTQIVWEVIEQRHLVVLDELGSREKVGDLHYQAVKRITDLRDNQPTIYIANLAPAALARCYDDRIASRILCGSIFELSGNDRRMNQ